MTPHAATRLPRQPGPSGWNAILPPRNARPPLSGNHTADIAIIGAGFAGLSAAHRLTELAPTINVAIVEAGTVGDGPAGRNSGFMIDLPHDLSSDDYAGTGPEHDRIQIARNRIAIGFARDFANRAGLPPQVFDPAGKINAAATPAGDDRNRAFGAHLARIKEPSALLDAAGMKDLTGTEFYTSGLFTPGAVIIQPAAYIRALADTLGPGACLFESSPVRQIVRDGVGWRLDTPGGALSAGTVILANNGHAGSFGFFPRQLMHVFTYASMTRRLTGPETAALGGRPNWAVTPADPMGTTIRRFRDATGDRIVVRARFTYDPSMQVSGRRLAAVGRMHDAKFRQRFPMLDGTTMEYRWAGQLCLSRNGAPAFGEVDRGVISAACQNGLGTVKGTLSGLAAAELALDHDGAARRALTDQPAPRRLPPEPLAWLGANAVMRWKEWRAGRE